MGQDLINIKGTRDGLVILVNPSYSFEEIKMKLQDKISSAKGFFSGAKFSLCSPDAYTPDETRQLAEICCQNGLIPHSKPINLYRRTNNSSPNNASCTQYSNGYLKEASFPAEQDCLLVQHNVRNGQVINYQGHITILGDVNPGAIIIAEGNVLVMGTLKGIAHAGSNGNKKAVIVAHNLKPTQLRIASTIARSPERQESLTKSPEIAYLADDKIVIKKYNTNFNICLHN
ncbi:septum site-determining protein MinC [Bacillota bacterium LX-D]|nr:septum site-determining protein MinC [Bacillota bacterium LX-D]